MKKISVLFAALAFALGCDNPKNATKEEKKIEVKMEKLSDTLVQATVTVNTTREGKKISKEFIYKGDEETVRAKIDALTAEDAAAAMDIKIEKQTLARHILIQTSEIRSEKQAKDLIEDLYNRSQNEDKFSDLARLYSDDPGSKMEGGELSWTGPGRFDPKFEEVMNSLEINQVSKPFKSNFGWHIVEVLDRREEDISLNIQKNRAYQILFDRKYEEQLEKTLSEMRAESYVNIKIKS